MRCVLFTFFFLIAISCSTTAQTDTANIHKASNQRLYRSGTILVSSEYPGKLYFDGKYIFNIIKFNLAKIRGIKPGIHTISFKTDSDSIRKEIKVRTEWKYTCNVSRATIKVKGRLATDPLLGTRVHTKLYKYVPKIRGFYNVTQVGLISIGMFAKQFSSANKQAGINIEDNYPLNYISTTCDYRFTPRFSMGLGAGYCLMKSGRIPFEYSKSNGWADYIETYKYAGTIGFFPVFVDIRTDLSLKKIAPVFYLDFGLILVYHQKVAQFDYYQSFGQKTVIVDIEIPSRTGPFFASAGFGSKIYITRGLAILPAIEISYKQVIYDVYQGNQYYSYHSSAHFLTLGLVFGISF